MPEENDNIETPEQADKVDAAFTEIATETQGTNGTDAPDPAGNAIDNEMAENLAEAAAAEQGSKLSIREMCRGLRNRVEEVMAATGKRPGDLTAFSAGLAEMSATEHPLLDCTD